MRLLLCAWLALASASAINSTREEPPEADNLTREEPPEADNSTWEQLKEEENSTREELAEASLTTAFCAKLCKEANPLQPCYWDKNCPGLGCGALGMTHCRYCGFGAYAHIPCREGPRPPPISSCSPLGTFDCEHSCFHPDSGPERNVITQTPGDPYYENQVTARGLEEQLQCSKVRGIGGTNMYSCVTNARREKSLRTAQFLQQITYSADCSFFVKKVWRMSPSPVETCTVKCPEASE